MAKFVSAISAESLIAKAKSKPILRSSTDVASFVSICSKLFNKVYKDKDTELVSEDGKDWITGLYNLVVVEGKDFKDSIPRTGGQKAAARVGQLSTDLPYWVDSSTEILLSTTQVFCYCVRGAEGATNIASEIHKFDDGSSLPVLTYRLLQAVVSIMVCGYDVHAIKNFELPPAKLGANVNAACKIPESKSDKQNWAIYGHYGLKFVANYVHHALKLKEEQRPKHIGRMPSIENLLLMAIRMDQANVSNIRRERARQKKAGTGRTDYPTIEAIFQTTGMSEAEQKKLMAGVKKLSPFWGTGVFGRAQNLDTNFLTQIDGWS